MNKNTIQNATLDGAAMLAVSAGVTLISTDQASEKLIAGSILLAAGIILAFIKYQTR